MKDKCEKPNLDLSEDLRLWRVYTVIKMMVSILPGVLQCAEHLLSFVSLPRLSRYHICLTDKEIPGNNY